MSEGDSEIAREMYCSEFDQCIKCNKGGKLLVCKNIGCPIVVHEKCMGCPARLDETGKFHCPWCLSQRAMVELNQAMKNAMLKRRAFSSFIDDEMMDWDKRKKKSVKTMGNLKFRSADAENAESSSNFHSGNRLGDDDVLNLAAQLDGNKEGFAAGCRNGISFRGGYEPLSHDHQNDDSTTREINCTKVNNAVHSQLAFGNSVVGGGEWGDVSCEEETGQQFQIFKVGRTDQDCLPRRIDDHELIEFQREVEDHQECKNLSGSLAVEERSGKRKRDDSESHEEDEIICTEDKQEATASNKIISILDMNFEATKGSETGDKISKGLRSASRKSNRIKKRGHCEPQPSSVDLGGTSSPTVRKGFSKTKKNVASLELKPPRSSPSKLQVSLYPAGRRKKLFWTEEEEKMLKEGVHQLSSKENKQLPWKEILEFGRHVFHSTRTPVDLKDKWRNMCRTSAW